VPFVREGARVLHVWVCVDVQYTYTCGTGASCMRTIVCNAVQSNTRGVLTPECTQSISELGLRYTDPAKTLRDAAASLKALGVVPERCVLVVVVVVV